MSSSSCTLNKIQTLFDTDLCEQKLHKTIFEMTGSSPRKSIDISQLHFVGERYGFLKRPVHPLTIAMFITKGGVLKTTLTLNLARVAALHNIRTCVVGLDMQGDISSALGQLTEDEGDLGEVLEQLDSVQGLSELLHPNTRIDDLIKPTDLPALWVIPETPELVLLSQQIQMRNRREYWLKENVVEPLKKRFDLILFDCSPNWNHLTTNALVACDALVSPLECKIHNFRNLKFFRSFIDEFKRDMNLNFKQCFVPTKFSPARKLSRDILSWYQTNLDACTTSAVRESLTSEEACALNQSVIEYSPKSEPALEMRNVIKEIWSMTAGRPAVMTRTPSPETTL